MLTDSELRKKLISERKERFTIDVKLYNFTNAKITDAVVELIKKLDAKTVMLYLPIRGETDITGITSLPLSFFVPVTYGVQIRPAEYFHGIRLIKGEFGVFVPEDPVYADKHCIDLVLVPAVAVDKDKNRLGYGKGCYDRFLADIDCVKAAVCFDFQVVDGLTPKPHDIKMDYIITESGCF